MSRAQTRHSVDDLSLARHVREDWVTSGLDCIGKLQAFWHAGFGRQFYIIFLIIGNLVPSALPVKSLGWRAVLDFALGMLGTSILGVNLIGNREFCVTRSVGTRNTY